MADGPTDEANFTFRVERALKTAFVQTAKTRNRNASLLLRDYMRQYVDAPASPAVPPPSPATGDTRER